MTPLNLKERVLGCLRYRRVDRMPVLHFGGWGETLTKWLDEGRLTPEEVERCRGQEGNSVLFRKLGFDGTWADNTLFQPHNNLYPLFDSRVIETSLDGAKKVLTVEGVVVIQQPGATGIPAEVDHLLKDRASWEYHYLPRVQFNEDRIRTAKVFTGTTWLTYDQGGREYLQQENRQNICGIQCGSLFGAIRNWLGVEGSAYLLVDDELLFDEIIKTVGDLCYQCVEAVLRDGAKFDYAHFWEDICFKNGPLIAPAVFYAKVAPHYRRITDLLLKYGVDIVSVDCDGKIDALIPAWLDHGVNTMFPIEVGTWNASIKPWRAQYGRALRGVGGMNKTVFARDRRAVELEIERLKPLVALGGFIPCPDHRIAPDAQWDLVRYYCDRMRAVFD